MKKLILFILLSVPLIAQETVTLSTPQPVAGPTITLYKLKSFDTNWDDPDTPTVTVNGVTSGDEGLIEVTFIGKERAVQNVCRYDQNTNPTATFLLNGLNKANLSSSYNGTATTGTLKQRIYHRLVIMNESATVCSSPLIGSLSGTVP